MRLKTAVAAALVLIALPWLFFKVRLELAIRTECGEDRSAVARRGKYQEASAAGTMDQGQAGAASRTFWPPGGRLVYAGSISAWPD